MAGVRDGEEGPVTQKPPRWKIHVCRRGCPFPSNLGPVLLSSSATALQPSHDTPVQLTPVFSEEQADVSFLVRVVVMGDKEEERDDAVEEGEGLRRYCQCLAGQVGEDATLLLPLALAVASTSISPSSSSSLPSFSTLSADMREMRLKRVEEVVTHLASLPAFNALLTPLPGAGAAR